MNILNGCHFGIPKYCRLEFETLELENIEFHPLILIFKLQNTICHVSIYNLTPQQPLRRE